MSKMTPNTMSGQDLQVLDKFTRFLTLKVAQVVVQSRQGKKITLGTVPENEEVHISNSKGLSPSQVHHKAVDWFNLAIPDIAEVTKDTKKVLNGEIVTALRNVFVIEISLRTDDGDEMILELWTVRINPETDPNMTSLSTIYYRMGIILKSLLSISRITPAYKISRGQANDSYKISYRIYEGPPNTEILGEGYKTIKISELGVVFGTIHISVLYRTVMTLTPNKKQNVANNNIMMKSDHFPNEQSKKPSSEKKVIDLNRPLTAGAFVDTERIRELHDTLSQQLPPEPPMAWLLAEKLKLEDRQKKTRSSESVAIARREPHGETASSSAPDTHTRAIEVPAPKHRLHSDSSKYSRMMEFPFADGSPITELASFYQECIAAKSASNDWDVAGEAAQATADSDSLSEQLKQFEDAVPEFDNIVASMFSNSDSSDSK